MSPGQPALAGGTGLPQYPPGATNVGTHLVGHTDFTRHNPMSDRFPIYKYHHVEFWTGEAGTTAKRFGYGLGMPQVAKSDQSTGNHAFASYVLQSDDVVMAFTAPYGSKVDKPDDNANPLPWFDQGKAHDAINSHGLFVRALGVLVGDAREAYRLSVLHGAEGVLEPQVLGPGGEEGELVVAEIRACGDCVLRFVSGTFKGPYLPGYHPCPPPSGGAPDFGLRRYDHAVFNTFDLMEAVQYLSKATGLHEFAEFVAEDVGTVDSGLNSMVLASNNEMVLMPVNEPTYGTKRKSQILTFLEQNQGPGLQHLALKTDDIFSTLREMRARSEYGGFDFMPSPGPDYYTRLPARIGSVLTPKQYREAQELGLLVDADDQGVLLQIFTKPLGDRPTVFFEIIQRLCLVPPPSPVPQPREVRRTCSCMTEPAESCAREALIGELPNATIFAMDSSFFLVIHEACHAAVYQPLPGGQQGNQSSTSIMGEYEFFQVGGLDVRRPEATVWKRTRCTCARGGPCRGGAAATPS